MSAYLQVRKLIMKRLLNTPRKQRFMAGVGFLTIAVLASFSIFATVPEPVIPEHLEKAWPVSVMEIAPERLAPIFSTFGKVESNNIAELRTNVIAEVTHVYVREGQWAVEGELLLELRKDELELRVNEMAANLAQQKAMLASIETESRLINETSEHFESVW